MDLMRRLKTAFIIIIVVPIFMILATGKIILDYQLYSVQETYDIEQNPGQLISNPLKLLNRITRSTFNQIMLSAMKNPEQLEDLDYIRQLNNDLSDKFSFIVVRKDEEIVFSGNTEEFHKLNGSLPPYGSYNTIVDGGTYFDGKDPFLLKQQDFSYSDGSKGTVFVITDLKNMVPQIKHTAIQMIVSFILILITTAVILIVWLYRSILMPLNTLKNATKEIRKGNLDYSISGDPEDEIGQLCQDFEEMRVHLKELIGVQRQYEHDSRELISNISHDLKTPLTAIKGYAEGILDGVADTPERQEKYLKTIYTKASDMTMLVDELSFFSEIDCKSVPYNFKEININRYFEDCIEELSLELELKNIHLEYENKADKSIKVSADAEQLKRVINNIIGNSVKYLGKSSGHIFIKIIDNEEEVLVSIEDDGIGIATKDLPYIFDRFYRADASRNSKRGGTGLGLSIVKKIVEGHSGRIWAESTEDAGTILYFTLPKYYLTDKMAEGELRKGEHKERKILQIKE